MANSYILTTQPDPLLQVDGLSKSFPGVRALDDVSLSLGHGEVLAVIGENGAGKSTLMKILAGVQAMDSGTVSMDGQPVAIRSVRDALNHKIALIHQELNLADNLDVGANVFLGREPHRFGWVDRKRIDAESETYLRDLGVECSPRTLVKSLSLGRQQLVEIAKAVSTDARILIMDEPTSSLSSQETDHLFTIIERLRKTGVSIIYISHRLREVQQIADRVVVLRDGKNAGELSREEITKEGMIQLMVGRDLSGKRRREVHHDGSAVALEVKQFRTRDFPHGVVEFNLHRGEILGIAGLTGSGRTELLEALFGIAPPRAGEVHVEGEKLDARHPSDAMQAGLALVPEDRKQCGLILEMSLRENLSLSTLRRDQRFGWLNASREEEIYVDSTRQLTIKTSGPHQIAALLSGGNQQKVVLGKWLALEPKILLLDEPTRGIDVGSKGEIYTLMERLAEQGVAILFASSELEEILGLSDRVLVMQDGHLAGELSGTEITEETIMHLATGAAKEQENS